MDTYIYIYISHIWKIGKQKKAGLSVIIPSCVKNGIVTSLDKERKESAHW